MREVVFVDGMRTPFGKMGGALRTIASADLAAMTVKALVAKTQIIEKGGKVDSVMCGSAASCSKSWSPARYITMASGLPFETSASFVEMQCGSAIDAINSIKARGGKDITFLCIIAAPEGLEKLAAAHPDVKIFVGNLDRQLNENAYICPGLGDAGDRIFGTK